MDNNNYIANNGNNRKFCIHCGESILAEAVICPKCGCETGQRTMPTKFCKHCGAKISEQAVICPHCGCQVEELKQAAQSQQAQPNIIINNTNTNTNQNINTAAGGYMGRMKNKWVAFFLCLFLGYWGIHKFYEGKIGMGILYIFTVGLFGIGWLVDLIVLLCKSNPYFV